jgi:hypothetical protein
MKQGRSDFCPASTKQEVYKWLRRMEVVLRSAQQALEMAKDKAKEITLEVKKEQERRRAAEKEHASKN